MEHKEAEKRRPLQEKAFFIFGFFMFLVYLAAGLTLIFSSRLLESYPSSIRIGLGGMLVAYSFFRLFRIIRQYR